MTDKIALRPVEAIDGSFLFSVYASTRQTEVSSFGWTEEQQNAFLRMQYDMRLRSYLMQCPQAESSVILCGDAPAGSIIVDRTPHHISITDIAVLPEFRRRGIAGKVIAELQHEADNAGVPVVLSVDKSNLNARRLYERLGFEPVGETELTIEMRWISMRDAI